MDYMTFSGDLNYEKYFVEGEEEVHNDEYHSSNTYQLSVDEIKEKLMGLYEIKDELKEFSL